MIDLCRKVRTRIADRKQLRMNVEQLKRFQKVRDVFAQRVHRLEPLLAVLQVLRNAALVQGDFGADARRLVTLAESARTLLADRAEALIDEQSFSVKAFTEEIAGIADHLEMCLQAAWQKYTDKVIPATNREVLDVLAAAFPHEVRLLRQRTERLDLIRRTLPKSAEELAEFNAEVSDVQGA